MPELPDIVAYLDALRPRVVGRVLRNVTIVSPFVLRSFDPPLDAACGRSVTGLRRIGKRIVFELADAPSDPLFLVLHLMIAGRLLWQALNKPLARRLALASLDFDAGRLVLTEAGTQKRASLALLCGATALHACDPGGLEPLAADDEAFAAALRRENHTLKRALTDPRLFSGIGNAYSDEILHAARLSPVTLTQRLSDEQAARLADATRRTLTHWTERLRQEFAGRFPGRGEITAFRPDFAVHGRFGRPCPACGTAVQRIRYAENETNYCPRCQTDGKLLADRSLSRLLKDDWPRTIEELEGRGP